MDSNWLLRLGVGQKVRRKIGNKIQGWSTLGTDIWNDLISLRGSLIIFGYGIRREVWVRQIV